MCSPVRVGKLENVFASFIIYVPAHSAPVGRHVRISASAHSSISFLTRLSVLYRVLPLLFTTVFSNLRALLHHDCAVHKDKRVRAARRWWMHAQQNALTHLITHSPKPLSRGLDCACAFRPRREGNGVVCLACDVATTTTLTTTPWRVPLLFYAEFNLEK